MSIVTLSTDIQNSGNTVPDWIQILPSGSEFSAVDGREFVIKDPSEVITLSTRKHVDIHIDYEHAIQDKTKDIKPAAGWIKELTIKDGAVWARVEWTPQATKMITNKEYRYLSPLLSTIPTIDGKHMISKIINVALTNHPALEMSAFCHDESLSGLQNLSAMSEIAELMNVQSCSPSGILTALKQKQIEQEMQACKADVQTALTQYVFPKSCEDEFLLMRQSLGQNQFQALTQKLSTQGFGFSHLLGMSQTQALKAKGISFDKKSNAHGLTDKELQVCKQTNVNPEDYARIKETQHDN